MSALAVTLASPALAQDADEDTPVTVDTAAPAASDEGIVVTGSRIRRNETTSASPLTIIDPSLQRKQGLNSTAEIIQQSPIANGSTQITSAISSNTITNGGPGAQTVSLRGLGAERTLVLLNGRRAGPAGTRGGVSAFDLNVLPSIIIEQVDVLKDGASSIYGSDAIAGVVNIRTKRATDGLEINAFQSVPFDGGGEESNISVAWGKEFDRGHILLAGDYFFQRELEKRDRRLLGCEEDYVFSEDGSRRLDLIDPRTGEFRCGEGLAWGHVWTYSSDNLPDQDPGFINPVNVSLLQFDYSGVLGQFLPPVSGANGPGEVIAPAGWYVTGYEDPDAWRLFDAFHPFDAKSSIIPETERFTLFGEVSFDITDSIEFYAEGLFNRRETYIDSISQFYNFGYTDLYAPGDPDDPFPGWTSFEQTGAFISPTGILDQYDRWIDVDYYRGIVGFKGDITADLQFDVHGHYSRSDGEYTIEQILQDVIDQQTARAFGAGCAGLVTPISNRPCLQVNWVDPRIMFGDFTEEEANYFTERETGVTIYEQTFAEASVAGQLFDLPAGPLGFALGGVIRRDEIDDTPGHITNAVDADGNIVDNAFSNDFGSTPTRGHSTTTEAFAEINIPVLADKPFFQSLEFSGAARVTNVKATADDGRTDSSNGNWTYKLLGNWQVNDWVRLRSTFGTSYRAPALFEQFLGSQTSGLSQRNVDPCVRWQQQLNDQTITQRIANNCQADQSVFGGPAGGIDPNHTGAGIGVTIFTSGGLGQLEPETSEAFTASVILTPTFSFLPDTDIALTVDYFDIKVEGEISRLTAGQIVSGCYDADDFPNNPFCSFFERGQDGNISNISTVRRQFINIDEQINKGIDFTLRVRQDLGNLGTLSFLGQATLQTEDLLFTFETDDPDDPDADLNGDVGDPKFVGQFITTWEKGNTALLYGITVVGASSSVEDYIDDFGSTCNPTPSLVAVYGETYCVQPFTNAVWYHNASITQTIDDRFDITLGISNIFDTKPPQVSGLVTEFGSAPRASQYDFLGRRAFVQAGMKF